MKTPDRISPYRLLQELNRHDPWRVLVCCVLLNQTSNKQVKLIIEELFRRWPTASTMATADADDLRELIRPLGFYNRRSETLKKLSRAYDAGFDDVRKLPGVGKYAADSYRMFVGRELVTDVSDKKLKLYVDWATEENGRDDR